MSKRLPKDRRPLPSLCRLAAPTEAGSGDKTGKNRKEVMGNNGGLMSPSRVLFARLDLHSTTTDDAPHDISTNTSTLNPAQERGRDMGRAEARQPKWTANSMIGMCCYRLLNRDAYTLEFQREQEVAWSLASQHVRSMLSKQSCRRRGPSRGKLDIREPLVRRVLHGSSDAPLTHSPCRLRSCLWNRNCQNHSPHQWPPRALSRAGSHYPRLPPHLGHLLCCL